MALNFSLFGNASKANADNPRLDSIADLKLKLVDIGYNPLEVDYMVMTHSQGKEVHQLDDEQLREVESALQDQLAIAKKCVSVMRSTRE